MAALPHGTEVTTRVDRHSGERRLASGTVGRVVRARDGGYDVHFVGVGELERARDLSPLPEEPDYERASQLVRRANLELARRFIHQVPGPFGQQAPPPPSWGTDAH